METEVGKIRYQSGFRVECNITSMLPLKVRMESRFGMSSVSRGMRSKQLINGAVQEARVASFLHFVYRTFYCNFNLIKNLQNI